MASKGKKVWSKSLLLRKAASRAPVLIRLLEGYRGEREPMSFSAGDTMALQGIKEVHGQRLLLVHYTSESEGEAIYGGADDDDYEHALLTLPYDRLPELDVTILEDPGGHEYRNFVSCYFPECNWEEQQDELLEDLDVRDYMNVNVIVPRRKQATSDAKENWSLRRRPPPPPPQPPKKDKPPPRPPRPGVKIKPPDLQPRPGGKPPRPAPRPSPSSTSSASSLTSPEEESSPSFDMPTFADLSPGGGFLFGDEPAGQGQPAVPLPEKGPKRIPQQSTEKGVYQLKKLGSGLAGKLKDVGKKVYGAVNKVGTISSRRPPPDPPEGDSAGEYVEIIEDDDSDEDYEQIDEKKMDPDLNKTEKEKKGTGAKKEKGEKQKQTQTQPASEVASAKPTVRVQPVPKFPSERLHMSPPNNDQDDESEVYEPVGDDEPKPLPPPERMNCRQLCERLRKCGMPELANVCQNQSLDGAFFYALSDDILMQPPFSLSNFEVDSKLKMVKLGWVPNT